MVEYERLEDDEPVEDRRPVMEKVRELAFAIADAEAVADNARARANSIAVVRLAGDEAWVRESSLANDAEGVAARARAQLAALRGDVDAVDELGCSFEFGTVRVTYPKRSTRLSLPADRARRLWIVDRAKAEEIGVVESEQEPRAPIVTVRPVAADTVEAARRAAGIQ